MDNLATHLNEKIYHQCYTFAKSVPKISLCFAVTLEVSYQVSSSTYRLNPHPTSFSGTVNPILSQLFQSFWTAPKLLQTCSSISHFLKRGNNQEINKNSKMSLIHLHPHPPQAFIPFISLLHRKYFSTELSSFLPSHPLIYIILKFIFSFLIQTMFIKVINDLYLTLYKDQFSLLAWWQFCLPPFPSVGSCQCLEAFLVVKTEGVYYYWHLVDRDQEWC